MYEILSSYYDVFFDESDYIKTAQYLAAVLENKKSGVDMGCGTGKITKLLLENGFDIYGVDLSVEMLNKATENLHNSPHKTKFILGSIESFKYIRPPEFVIAAYDVINYLKNPLKAFKNTFEQLKSEGLFVFDMSTKYKFENILAGQTYSQTKNDITYIWNNYLSEKGSAVEMELTFFERAGELYKKSVQYKKQYIHDESKIEEMLSLCGFKQIRCCDGYSEKKASKSSQRILFIAQKP